MAEGLKSGSSDEHTKDFKSEEPNTPAKPKDGIFNRAFTYMELDVITVILMIKGALPPVIVLSMYQSNAVSGLLGSLGYLSAIISLLSMAMMPRARFLQSLLANCFAAGLAAALGMLVILCSVKARQHTIPQRTPTSSTASSPATPGSQALTLVPYNSSASVISAVYLFFSIYLINILKFKFPQLMVPTILFSIVIVVSCTSSPLIPTIPAGYIFIKSLLKAIYIGLGVATGVSLFVVPIACRNVIKKEITGLLTSFQTCLQAHRKLLQSLEDPAAFEQVLIDATTGPDIKTVRASVQKTLELQAKLNLDLPFAKREIGFGKLGPDEMKSINKLARLVMLPVVGLASIIDVMGYFASSKGWKGVKVADLSPESEKERQAAIQRWTENLKLIRQPVNGIVTLLIDGIDHVLYQLQLKPRPKVAKTDASDVENNPNDTSPGSPGFAAFLDEQSSKFYSEKHLTLIKWGRQRGFQFPDDFFAHPGTAELQTSDEIKNESRTQYQQHQRQLYLLLYTEYLLYTASRSLLDLVIWVDKIVSAGLMARNRLIVPNAKRIKKLFSSVLSREDVASDDATLLDVAAPSNNVYLGSSYNERRNPEHLPPTTKWEHFGDKVRKIPDFMQSSGSQFGFRVACATLSISLIMFLHQTQRFSYEYRLFWSIIMTAISMTPTSGQSLFGFFLRGGGTFAAMLASWIIYYVAGNGKTPGIIVLYWFFVACGLWIPLKRPQFAAVGVITIITITLTIGYELEAKKLGSAALEATGQKYLSILIFGPVRLATVLAGLLVAFIWTIFPYPISEHASLRRDTAHSLYILASYYSIVHETVSSRIRRVEGDLSDKDSPGNRLERARIKAFGKQMLMLSNLKTYSRFMKWEAFLGGKFPKKEYDTIIQAIESITRYMSLISYASMTYREEEPGEHSPWSTHFRELMGQIRPTSHEVVMVLTLLSGAMREGRPLPPYLPTPPPYALSERLEAIDGSILSIRHVNEPGYAAFAVMQLAARCIGVDVERLMASVKELVGVLDFSIHVEPSHATTMVDLGEDTDSKRKGD